jgi:chemotaxis protein MotB
MTACVSARKYETTVAESERLSARVNLQADSLERLESLRRLTTTGKLDLEEKNRLMDQELTSLRRQYAQLERANTDLLSRYDRVLAQNQAELATSSSELGTLRQELSQKELTLARQESTLNELSSTLNRKEADLNTRIAELSTDLSSSRKAVAMSEFELNEKTSEVNQLRAALAAKDAKLNALRERMQKALTGFSASDLSVEERRGKVYVSLSQNLLFASGSKTLNKNGTDALGQVAQALKQQPDINITVEGHTDTDGSASLNWDLSTARATTVAQRLIQGGVNPNQVTAAGRGQFQPVADNSTAAGKALNRRTEIILTPQLGELYELVTGSR